MVEVRKIPPEDSGLSPDARDLELAEMRQQLQGLTTLVSAVLAARDTSVVAPTPPPPLEARETERDRVLAAWAAEPRTAIFIAPDENDRRAADDLQARGLPAEFPPRIFQVNGVQLAVPVGESTTVPESIAAMYSYMLNPWKSQQKQKPLTFDAIAARLG
jgi:hypothetical protein